MAASGGTPWPRTRACRAGAVSAPIEPVGSLQDVLHGAAESADGRTNLFGALARTMAKTGYRDLKEFQRVDLVIGGAIGDESR